jgi:hypothetical protein
MSATKQLFVDKVQFTPNLDPVLVIAYEQVQLDDGSIMRGTLVNVVASQEAMGTSWGDAEVEAACKLDARYATGWTVVFPTAPAE